MEPEQLSIAEDAHTLEHCSGHISILCVCFSQYCRDQVFSAAGRCCVHVCPPGRCIGSTSKHALMAMCETLAPYKQQQWMGSPGTGLT